jgi:hypothetical protein
MVWKDGRIDLDSSYVFVPSLAPVITFGGAGLLESKGFDVEAATYRAATAA